MTRKFDANKIKLAAFDIDGTIFENGTILEETAKTIMSLSDRGVETILSSGRHPMLLPIEIKEMPCFRYAIGANGGIISDVKNDTVLQTSVIPTDKARQIGQYLCTLSQSIHLVGEWYSYMTEADREWLINAHPLAKRAGKALELDSGYSIFPNAAALCDAIDKPVIKFGICFSSAEEAVSMIPVIKEKTGMEAVRTGDIMAEITASGVSKFTGISWICANIGILPENVIAFGDSGNDICMLKNSGFGVAMGNATEDVKQIADYVTLDVAQDGVGHAIRKLFAL